MKTSAGLRSVGARDEAKNLGLSSVIKRLTGSVNEGSERIVAVGSLDHDAASGVSSAQIQQARLASGAGYRFAGPSAAEPQANRIDVLLRLQSGGRAEN